MHTDEAVNAALLGEMFAGRPYVYNPRDFHGPAFYFLAEPILRLLGVRSLATMEAWQLRLIPSLAWSALIALLPLLRAGLGAAGTLAAAGLLALAAPFAYFSTDFIHESLFLLATVLAIATGTRFLASGRWGWAILFGLGLGAMVATKETVSLTFAAAGGAWIFSNAGPPKLPRERLLIGGGAAVLVAALTVVALFTSFGANPGGLRDLVTAGGNFADRATGQGHEKPWWTYAQWLFAPTVRGAAFGGWVIGGLAVAGAILGRHRPLVRFLALLGGGLFVIYSAIPYKTPWLALNFLVPLTLVAGVGAGELWGRGPRTRFIVAAGGALALAALAQETWRWCGRFSVDPYNPYAYAASSADGKRLADRVEKLMAGHGEESVQVLSADYWPLPWLLRRVPRVGYWSERPANVEGRVLVTSPELAEEGFEGYRPAGIYGLRPDVLACVFVREDSP